MTARGDGFPANVPRSPPRCTRADGLTVTLRLVGQALGMTSQIINPATLLVAVVTVVDANESGAGADDEGSNGGGGKYAGRSKTETPA